VNYKPYPKYKHSGVEWIGEVPEEWEVSTLGRVAKLSQGVQVPLEDQLFEQKDGYIRFLRIENYTQHSDDFRYIPIMGNKSKIVEEDDIVMVRYGTVGFVGRGISGVLANNLFKVEPNPSQLTKKFIYLQLNSKRAFKFFETSMFGTAMQALSFKVVRELELTLQPLPEQRAIASFLDRETSRINKLIALKERQIELLKEKRQALISHAVTKGLNPNAKMKPSGIEWLGDVPEGWDIVRAKVIFKEINDRSETGEEELLTVSHITGVTRRSEKNVTMFMADSLQDYKKCEAGDLVINTMWAWMGAMGFTREAGIVSPSYNVYRPRENDIEPWYYDFLFRTRKFISEVIGNSQGVWTSRLRLYPESFFNIRIPLPPIEEQGEILAFIKKETGKYEKYQEKIAESITMLSEYRVSLISAAVTGKIDVREEA